MQTRDLGTRVSDLGSTRDPEERRERNPDKSLQSRVMMMTEMRQHLIRLGIEMILQKLTHFKVTQSF